MHIQLLMRVPQASHNMQLSLQPPPPLQKTSVHELEPLHDRHSLILCFLGRGRG